MSIEPVMISAKVARPSWVRVVRGAPVPRQRSQGWRLPLSIVAEWMNASCSSSWSRSSPENIASARMRITLLPAVALEGSCGSSTTSTGSSAKKPPTRSRSRAANSAAGMSYGTSGTWRESISWSVIASMRPADWNVVASCERYCVDGRP